MDSRHDARERSTAELEPPRTSQALGCYKHESSRRDAAASRYRFRDNTGRH